MRKQNIISFLAIFLLMLIYGCTEDTPLAVEQYIKQAYIVGSDQTSNMGVRIVEIPYRDNALSETSISVAIGGSLNIDRDIEVLLKNAGTDAIDDYNFKFINDDDVKYQHLNAASYQIPDFNVEVKAGEIYGVMPIGINTNGLHADSLYALTFQIETISDPDYVSIRQTDTVLMLSFKFINDFSGSSRSIGYDYPIDSITGLASGDSLEISTLRVLTALDSKTVRLLHLLTVESYSNLAGYGITLKIENDNSVVLAPWDNLVIVDGEGVYDPLSRTITYWYVYSNANVYRKFSGTLTKTGS